MLSMVIKITQWVCGRAKVHSQICWALVPHICSSSHGSLPSWPLDSQDTSSTHALLSREVPDSPQGLIYAFHISSLPPVLREEGKGGNGVPKSDLYNLLAALVKGFGAKRLKLMTTIRFMY